MRRQLILLILSLIGFGCSGSISQTCPDGEQLHVLRNIDDAYPAYVQEYDAGLSAASKVLADTKIGAILKEKAVRLREELNQDNIELQDRRKAVVSALQTRPCDKGVRDTAIYFLTEVKNKTKRIPDRMKELHDEVSLKLYAEVSNLLYYPNTARDTSPPTILEDRMRNKLPRHLFDLLSGYHDLAILGVPNVGDALREHKMAYSRFRASAQQLEDSLTPRIGEMVAVRFPVAWTIYLKYIIMRFGGASRAQIVKAGTVLNYAITWNECERIYRQLSKDESVSRSFSETFRTYESLVEGVNKIASAI